MNSRHLRYERQLWANGVHHVAGVDEAGRGPLAGPVVAAAVIMPQGSFIKEVDDSKLLSPGDREQLYDRIHEMAVSIGVGVVDHSTIDQMNILNASFKAMQEAVGQLSPKPDHLLIDGNRYNEGTEDGSPAIPFTLIVDGDARSFSVAAASIIAKVTRDRMMVEYDRQFPAYGFARHKGYATPEHREAVFRLGYCEIHRRSFSMKQQLELEFQE